MVAVTLPKNRPFDDKNSKSTMGWLNSSSNIGCSGGRTRTPLGRPSPMGDLISHV